MANMKNEQKRQSALTALLVSNSLSQAAETAGISRRTLYNYIHNDIDFSRAYYEMRSRQAINVLDSMTERMERAQSVLMEMLEDADQPAVIRLKAAQMILSVGAEQEKTVSGISRENIEVNRPMFDFTSR